LHEPNSIRWEELPAAFSFADGFHRADWDIIGRWIDANVSAEERAGAWSEAALAWVSHLRDDLGGDYAVHQSRQTLLLTDQDSRRAAWLLEYAGRTADTIQEHWGDVGWQGMFGKDIVLIFSDHDDYYQYLSFHTAEGEHPTSGGVCVRSGYTHIAIPWEDEFAAANAIIHELSHDSVSHLELPLWLDEGVAVTLQRAVAPPPRGFAQGDQDSVFAAAIDWRPPMMWDELAERHFAFWNEDNIQQFWAGTSFFQPGDSNELSYSLAEVFLKLITERITREAFRDFLTRARSEDAGQTAALDILKIDLGDIAGTFLGEGNWRPHLRGINAAWEKAGWNREAKPHG
jgi:hypothetical protein